MSAGRTTHQKTLNACNIGHYYLAKSDPFWLAKFDPFWLDKLRPRWLAFIGQMWVKVARARLADLGADVAAGSGRLRAYVSPALACCLDVALQGITDQVQRLRQTINELYGENTQSFAKHGQLEDTQRRDTLLFYGLPDIQSDFWAQAEEKVVGVLSTCLNMSPY